MLNGFGHIAKDPLDNERGNLMPPLHGLTFPISSRASSILTFFLYLDFNLLVDKKNNNNNNNKNNNNNNNNSNNNNNNNNNIVRVPWVYLVGDIVRVPWVY